MKRKITILLTGFLCISVLVACGKKEASKESADVKGDITVVSREDGSGTRGAFIELFKIEEKNDKGEKVDNTTVEASITNNTSVMLTTVAGDTNAIGYVSLGSLNDSVKALEIDGVKPTGKNVKADQYKVARPFNVVTKGEVSDVAKDFMAFILSEQGQKIVTENGYISLDGATKYEGTKVEGKLVVAGSSSVSPVMEKLKEAYMGVNGNATIEIQTNDSTTGIQSIIEGICDIGMASRGLKESELKEGLDATVIAMDGIAIIANKENSINGLSSEQVKNIFVGEALTWEEATN